VNHLVRSGGNQVALIKNRIFSKASSQKDIARISCAVETLYSCEHGLDYGRNTRYQRASCMTHGNCEVNLPVIEYMRRYRLNESEYQLAERYMKELRTVLDKAGGYKLVEKRTSCAFLQVASPAHVGILSRRISKRLRA